MKALYKLFMNVRLHNIRRNYNLSSFIIFSCACSSFFDDGKIYLSSDGCCRTTLQNDSNSEMDVNCSLNIKSLIISVFKLEFLC